MVKDKKAKRETLWNHWTWVGKFVSHSETGKQFWNCMYTGFEKMSKDVVNNNKWGLTLSEKEVKKKKKKNKNARMNPVVLD